MRYLRMVLLCSALLMPLMHFGQLQPCTLGIGTGDTEVIMQVFKLNEEQKLKAEEWAAEYQQHSRLIEEEVAQLFKSHPQQSPKELQDMALKYDSLRAHLVGISRGYDQKLIGLFDQRQYEVYVKLCNEVIRRPLTPAEDME